MMARHAWTHPTGSCMAHSIPRCLCFKPARISWTKVLHPRHRLRFDVAAQPEDASSSSNKDNAGTSFNLEELLSRTAPPPRPSPAPEPEEPVGNKYPAPPQREWLLPDLLVAAGILHPETYSPGVEGHEPPVPEVAIRNLLTCNSKRGLEKSLYICTPALNTDADGHDYVKRAVEEFDVVAVLGEEGRELPELSVPVVYVPSPAGVLGRLASAFYGNPADRLKIIGVLGSHGKTTTTWLARGILEERGILTGMVGSIEYAIAEDRLSPEGALWEPLEPDVAAGRDSTMPFHIAPYRGRYGTPAGTPDPMHLHKVLGGICDRGATHALVELSFSALARDRGTARLANHVLVFTGIHDLQSEMPGLSESMCEDIVYEAFAALPEGATAVLNTQDPLGERLVAQLQELGSHRVITFQVPKPNQYSDSPHPDVYADRTKHSIWETEVMLSTLVGRLQVILPLPGTQNVASILAAACVGLAVNATPTQIVKGLEAVDLIPGHSEVIDEGQAFSVVVDGARSAKEVERLLQGAKEKLGAKRVVVVMGAKGRTSARQRGALGAALHQHADIVFLTNDSPGADWPDRIINHITAGFPAEVKRKYAGAAYPWLQDPHRVPQWFQRTLLQYQSVTQRYVIEDRLSAIRVALGMAKARDVIFVLGKGSEDYQEYWDGLVLGRTIKGWFEDRVECRIGLVRLPVLEGIKDLNRDYLPWTRYPSSDRRGMEMYRVQEKMRAKLYKHRHTIQRLRGRTPKEALARLNQMVKEENEEQEDE